MIIFIIMFLTTKTALFMYVIYIYRIYLRSAFLAVVFEKLLRPTPKFEDLGPEAFGLPKDTPWPPDASLRKKGPFDYGHWDKIVEDVERQEKVLERYEALQKSPKYEYRDGQKMQVIY